MPCCKGRLPEKNNIKLPKSSILLVSNKLSQIAPAGQCRSSYHQNVNQFRLGTIYLNLMHNTLFHLCNIGIYNLLYISYFSFSSLLFHNFHWCLDSYVYIIVRGIPSDKNIAILLSMRPNHKVWKYAFKSLFLITFVSNEYFIPFLASNLLFQLRHPFL